MDAHVSAPVNGGPVIAEDNIINRKVGQDQSLYQICVNLRRRLGEVPGFEPHLQETIEDDEEEGATDPVTSLWRCFRKGYPLMTICNASNPEVPLEVDVARVGEAKVGKAATFKFLHACMTEFGFLPQDCFLITDLFTDDTNGFVKVAKVVNRVLDILNERGQLYKTEETTIERVQQEPGTLSHSERVIEELVRTEKDYIGHLEMLQLMKNALEETGKLTGDSIYSIFLNLNNILDFGRRFLIRIEQHDGLPKDQQNWGQLFVHYQSAFSVYEPFIANNSRCTSTVDREWDKISMIADHSRDLQQMVASVATLSGFLLKPFQRMTKYPMMLADLKKSGKSENRLDEGQVADIDAAIEAIQEVLTRANSAVDKEHRAAAVTELHQRVDDWKGIKRDSFGELLLFGNFTVLKGDGGKDTEREVREFFDELDPLTKALLRSILVESPILRVAGMNQRAFTRKRRVVVRRKESPPMTPMTPEKPTGLTGAIKSASRSVSHGLGRLFSAGPKKDAVPQFALEGGNSRTPNSMKSSVSSIFGPPTTTGTLSSVASSSLGHTPQNKPSLPSIFRRVKSSKSEETIPPLPISSVPQASSLSCHKIRKARSQTLRYDDPEDQIHYATPAPGGPIPALPLLPRIPGPRSRAISQSLTSYQPEDEVFYETPIPDGSVQPLPHLPFIHGQTPPTSPTRSSPIPPAHLTPFGARGTFTSAAWGVPTPAASRHSQLSQENDDYFGYDHSQTPTRSSRRPTPRLYYEAESSGLGKAPTPYRAPSPYSQPFRSQEVPFDGDETPQARSPVLSCAVSINRDTASRAGTPLEDSCDDLSIASQMSQSRLSCFKEKLKRSVSRLRIPLDDSHEAMSVRPVRPESRLSRFKEQVKRPPSRAGTSFDDSYDDMQLASQRGQSRMSTFSRLSTFKEKVQEAFDFPKVAQAMKVLVAPLKTVTPLTENFILNRRRKKTKLIDLIHTFLFDGTFSQANVFLSTCGVVNQRSPKKNHWKSLDTYERSVANLNGLSRPYVVQYSIYLFERILLCCKDVNPTKQRPSVMGRNKEKPLANQRGKPRLQLKGRIFMANVTEIVSLSKIGSYTVQIFWKGDPGVENFIIRFQNEEVMRKWYKAIDAQRAIRSEERARQQGTSNTQFNYLMTGPQLQNPYQLEEDGEFEEEEQITNHSEFPMSRNASSTSLRARSATGGSGGSGGTARPPRFPMPDPGVPPLSLQTQFSNISPSPSKQIGNSYFSPVEPTPLSTRSSTQSGSYFSRQPTPVNAREAENNRYTAPALSRVASRESQSSYYSNGRTPRPSLQPTASSVSAQQLGMAQNRARSASSPDIHNPNLPGSRRYPGAPNVDNVPVPPIPAHMAGMRAPINRSQNNSPTNGFPIRNAAQPQQYGYRHPNSAQYGYEQAPRTDGRAPMTVVANGVNPSDRVLSPPVNGPTNGEPYMPGQLKAKVSFEDNYVTLVIASNIHFRSLTDRVEAKLARFTNRPIGKNSVRLRYKDEDGDFVTIDSDEAVQEAFLEWREQHRNLLAAGQMGQVGEIQLYCQVVDAV